MDGYSGKEAADGLFVSRKASALVLRERASKRDQSTQLCSRVGCSSRVNSANNAQFDFSEKHQYPRRSFRSSSGKDISGMGSSSRASSAIGSPRKCLQEPFKKLSTQLEADLSEASNGQDEPEASELIYPPEKMQKGLDSEPKGAEISEVTTLEVGSSSMTATDTRPRKNYLKKSVFGSQGKQKTSSSYLLSGSNSLGIKGSANSSRNGFRNLKCNSISDVIPSGCSSLEIGLNRRKEMEKRRNFEGESSSSSRGRKLNVSLETGLSSSSKRGVSISDSRKATNWPPSRDSDAVSARNCGPIGRSARPRPTNHGSSYTASPTGHSVMRPQIPQPEISSSVRSHRFSVETYPNCRASFSRPGSRLRDVLPAGPAGFINNRPLMNRDSIQQHNMDGIAEVLFAIERIEQDEELTYDQLLVLEANIFLNGLSSYDRHRDMRLDIDDMTYEELLALEEKMGSVSTALSEEALSKCLVRSICESPPSKTAFVDLKDAIDDVKCSICQEDYVVGDEVGRLQCTHKYHVACVQQWLRLKNWCPICKASASPSS